MTSPKKTVATPSEYTEVPLRHPALPAGLDAAPALPPDPAAGGSRSGWTFRPSVLATLVDALAGRGGGDQRTGYRYEPEAGVAVLVEPTSQNTPMPLVSDWAAHCPPPPAVYRALPGARWTVADQQPTPIPDHGAGDGPDGDAGTRLAVLATPDGRDIEETYVHAAADVEQLDPTTWVTVSGNWCLPSRPGRLIVPAGLVALYEPEIDGEPMPDVEMLPDPEAWLPDCRHCGAGLVEPCGPGALYPYPDLGPGASPWCPKHPNPDRPRPHAAIWRVVRY